MDIEGCEWDIFNEVDSTLLSKFQQIVVEFHNLEFLQNYATYIESGNFQSVNPFFDEELSYTGGIPLYQEQLMKMAVKVGFTLDESEQLRRIVGKKKVDQIEAWKQKIEDKIKENRWTKEMASLKRNMTSEQMTLQQMTLTS